MQEKIYCHICNTQTGYSNWNYFIDRHVKGYHKLNLSKKEYIEKYNVVIDDNRERIKCLICGEQTDYIIDNFYASHVKRFHPEIKSTKEYYDMFFKKDSDGICPECGKETVFESYYRGYRKYCSQKCSKASEESRNLLSEIKKKQYENPVIGNNIKEKSKQTCLEKYGVENYSKTSECREKVKTTNLERYGSETTLQLDQVKNARINALEENKEEINEKRKAFWTDENIEIVNKNREDSVLEKYGVKSVSQLDWVMEKVNASKIITCREKYGVDNVMQVKEIVDRVKATNIENGVWHDIENLSEYKLYRREVDSLSRKHFKKLYEEWNGYDYYTKEKLNDDLNVVEKNAKLAPSVDHKISVCYGFINNLKSEEIAKYENLCICSKSTNSTKTYKCEEEFLEYLKIKKGLKK